MRQQVHRRCGPRADGDEPLTLADRFGTVHERLVCVGIGDAATAAWLASESGVFDTTVCFYGSGIRDHADMVPKCPCLVVLAALERPFDTLDLSDRLHGHPNTTVVIYDARDGFCDEGSPPLRRRGVRLRVADGHGVHRPHPLSGGMRLRALARGVGRSTLDWLFLPIQVDLPSVEVRVDDAER